MQVGAGSHAGKRWGQVAGAGAVNQRLYRKGGGSEMGKEPWDLLVCIIPMGSGTQGLFHPVSTPVVIKAGSGPEDESLIKGLSPWLVSVYRKRMLRGERFPVFRTWPTVGQQALQY